MEKSAWRVRVHASGPSHDVSIAYVRQHEFELGAPVSFDPEYGRVTALEYLLAALGAELTGGLRALGRQRRLRIERTEAVVSAELANPLVYLGVVGEEGSTGLGRVAIKVYIGADEPTEAIDRLWCDVLQKSPLVQTLQAAVALDITMQIVD